MFVVDEKSCIGKRVGERVSEIVQNNANQGKTTSIAVSGSSQPILLGPVFMELSLPWNMVHFYFSDERCVGLDDADSNFAAWNKHFFIPKSIPKENIHSIVSSFSSSSEVADLYEKDLQSLPMENNLPVFDIILLGMGPDGHTCSLFPGHPQINEKERLVTYILDSPKPPKERITLTLPVLNNAHHVYFVATGKDKAPRIEEIVNHTATFPSAFVQPTHGELLWFVDKAAMNQSFFVCLTNNLY